jgi:(p)ppGpp synthase/HD superfamily hydrolase
MHEGQRRQIDGAPFILHPLEVASLLYAAGAPDQLIAAGVLHDTIEKTNALATDLRDRFGSAIAALVLAVTEDNRIKGYAKRKAALRAQVANAGEEALLLFAADKLSKVRELRLGQTPASQTREQPAGISSLRPRKLAHYRHCLRLLESHIPDAPLVRQLRAEMESLAAIAAREPIIAGTR